MEAEDESIGRPTEGAAVVPYPYRDADELLAICRAGGVTIAEVALEHSLGLTCDPVGGLVQVPCIERNAVDSVKAINAARLSLHGDGTHRVSLDQAIETMRQTGRDMKRKYKKTSKGGLAVNVPLC